MRFLLLMTSLAFVAPAADLPAQTRSIDIEPGTRVAVSLQWGELRVIGDSGSTVRLTELPERQRDSTVIAATTAPVSWRFERDELIITQDTAGRGRFPTTVLEVRVPRSTALRLAMTRGGEIEVRGVEGDTEITNHNGSVQLIDVGGALRVTAMNGEIVGSIRSLGASASFASLNGQIDLTLPADATLTARLRTSNGRLRSEFPVRVGERTSSLGAGVEVTARINGGGVPFIATTRSGDVVLRRATGRGASRSM